LKVNDENRRIRSQDPDPNLDPDPLVRGMDPRIRIRIHPKMSWIRNTGRSNGKKLLKWPKTSDKKEEKNEVTSVSRQPTLADAPHVLAIKK
jgi:hypothetical protein